MDQVQINPLTHKPFFHTPVTTAIDLQIMDVPDLQRAHFHAILAVIDPKLSQTTPVTAGVKALNRYSILPGKTFASSPKAKEKFKVLRLVANDVIVLNLRTQGIKTVAIDVLLKDWTSQGFQEITILSEIIDTVKAYLGPVLGAFLTGALIAWLAEKLS
jgi:hypothetical protein